MCRTPLQQKGGELASAAARRFLDREVPAGTGGFLPNARVSTVWAHICAMLRFFRELRSMWRQYQEFGLEVCVLPLCPSICASPVRGA